MKKGRALRTLGSFRIQGFFFQNFGLRTGFAAKLIAARSSPKGLERTKMSSDHIPHLNHVKGAAKERSPLQMMGGGGQMERLLLVKISGLNTVQMTS